MTYLKQVARQWPALQQVLLTFAVSIPNLIYMGVVLLLFMFMAAVAGMQLFGNH